MLRLTLYSILLSLITFFEMLNKKNHLNKPPVKRWQPIIQGTDNDMFTAYLNARFERDNNLDNKPLKN